MKHILLSRFLLISLLFLCFFSSKAQVQPEEYFDYYITPDHAFASQPGTWRVILKTKQPILRSTQFKLLFIKGFRDLQILLPNSPSYVKASASRPGVRIQINGLTSSYVENMPFWDMNMNDRVITFTVRDADLQAGDSIIIGIGDGNSANARAVAHETACRDDIEMSMQLAGTSGHVLHPQKVSFHIRPNAANEVYLFAHTVFKPSEQGKLLITTADPQFNIAESFTGTIQLSGPGPDQAVYPPSVTLTPEDSGKKEIPIYFIKEGTFRFSGSVVGSPNLPVRTSNPILVRDDIPYVYWGDLHSHGAPSRDGIGRGVYHYARYARALDFFCATDHADHGKTVYGISEKEWLRQKQEVQYSHKPGEFVAYLGYENSFDAPSGHYNVIFNFTDEQLMDVPQWPLRLYPNILEIWRLADSAGIPVMTIPHHCGKIFNFGIEGNNCKSCNTFGGIYKNEKYKRLIEIYSFHGLSESYDTTHNLNYRLRSNISRLANGPHYAQNAWAIGEKLGVIASTDDHIGHPGTNPIGMVAVYADALDRDPVFNSLQNRACYGTTGERIFLDFRLNGAIMGSELRGQAWDRPKMSVDIVGTDSIDYVELLKWDFKRGTYDGIHPRYQVIRKWQMDPQNVTSLKATFNDLTLADSCLYYVRVKQRNMIRSVLDMKETWAWSSPIWWSTEPYPDSIVTDSLLTYYPEVEKKTVVHNWSVANPVYTAYFDVERLNDNGIWELLERVVPDRGNIPDYRIVEPNPRPGTSVYRLIMHLVTGKSDTSAIDSVNLSFDELGNLTAVANPYNVSRLSWKVTNEKYSERYVVEVLKSGEFDALGELPATNSPDELETIMNYSHNLPDTGAYTYRVKQLLQDGIYRYTDTATVFWISNATSQFNVADYLTLRSNLLSKGQPLEIIASRPDVDLLLKVVDASGRLLQDLGRVRQLNGMKSYSLNLSAGTYYLTVEKNGQRAGLPFVVQ